MHRQIAGKLTGRVTKWVVLAVWIVIVIAAGSVASKLSDVQDNQASSWLPGSAESTKVLDKTAPFQDQNDIPTIVVYVRDAGLTADDLAAQMAGKVWLSSRADALLDEIPTAYKDIDQVMADQADLVTIDHTLSQILNYKGS